MRTYNEAGVIIMDRIVRNAISLAVAIGTSGLMFAATLA
jgi:hypothetical protein